jgi:hypothetical protein
MKTRLPPRLVPTENLASYFLSRGIAFTTQKPIKLGFGHGHDQYRLDPYPGPADDETMGVFCEWHTEDYFDVDSGPHFAIGMRGPVEADPHRGRGLAIGILANRAINPDDPNHPIPLFKGCPDPPGGPSFFIEDFTICDGKTPISEWQLSKGKCLPELQGNGIYRIDVHVSRDSVWAGVWQVTIDRSVEGEITRDYTFMGQTVSPDSDPEIAANIRGMGVEDMLDRGQGNVFIGTGFSDPNSRSRVENIFIAHWKNQL